MEEKNKWGDRLMYFLLGGAMGATIALLFAPRSGEETRGLIVDKVRGGSDAIKDYLNRGKDLLVSEKEVISAAIEAGKKAYKEEKQASSRVKEKE